MSESSVKTAITLAKTRLEQLNRKIQEQFDRAVEYKSRAEALAEYLDELGTNNGMRSIGKEIYERMMQHVEKNNNAIADTKGMLAKAEELEDLIKMLEGTEK